MPLGPPGKHKKTLSLESTGWMSRFAIQEQLLLQYDFFGTTEPKCVGGVSTKLPLQTQVLKILLSLCSPPSQELHSGKSATQGPGQG